jgi:hypothetical protein
LRSSAKRIQHPQRSYTDAERNATKDVRDVTQNVEEATQSNLELLARLHCSAAMKRVVLSTPVTSR